MLGLIGMAMVDFTVSVDGNVLTVDQQVEGTEYPLNVAEACSGMRMVVAFIALAGRSRAPEHANEWWKRITLFMSCASQSRS